MSDLTPAALDKEVRRRRDLKRDVRVRARGGDDVMPSLTEIAGLEQSQERAMPDVLATFQKQANSGRLEVPDLLSAFTRAARDRQVDRGGDDTGAGVESDRTNGPNLGREGPGRER